MVTIYNVQTVALSYMCNAYAQELKSQLADTLSKMAGAGQGNQMVIAALLNLATAPAMNDFNLKAVSTP